jgi:hypothetical protein
MRWSETGNATAFLIDQDRRVGTFDAIAKLAGEMTNLIRCFAIPGKQDEPNGIGFSKKFCFLGSEFEAATAKYYSASLGHFIYPVE